MRHYNIFEIGVLLMGVLTIVFTVVITLGEIGYLWYATLVLGGGCLGAFTQMGSKEWEVSND